MKPAFAAHHNNVGNVLFKMGRLDEGMAELREALRLDPKLIDALKGLQMTTPFGPVTWRALDHQSTMGAYVGQLGRKGDQGVMVNWRFADGANFLPSNEEVKSLRKE